MKQYVAALACAAAVYASAQTSPIPAPADWRAESFIFPLQFAPSIPYEGVEYVRFAPSWTRFDSEGGFSYVILWDVKARPVAPEDLEDYLEAYFTGLMRNVGAKRELSDKEIKTAAAAHPMAALARLRNVSVIEIPASVTGAITSLAARNMRIDCTIQDAQMWLAANGETLHFQPIVLKAP